MSPEERRGPGNAGLGRGSTTRGGVTPQGGAGALGTVMARSVTPSETLCSMQVVNRAAGERCSKPYV